MSASALKRVLLVGDYAPAAQQSMRRFSEILGVGLRDTGHEIRLLRPLVVFGRLAPSTTALGKWLGYIDRFIVFSVVLRRAVRWADIVHVCDHSNAPVLHAMRGVPHVITCHDLTAIRSATGSSNHRTRPTGQVLQWWIARCLAGAQRIVCVSEQTRRDLHRFIGVPERRVTVVPNALNYPYCRMPQLEAKHHLEQLGLGALGPFLLHVGGNQWYKNREGVLRIFRHLCALPGRENYSLVMVGKPWTTSLRSLVARIECQSPVMEVVNPSNEELRALYSTASGLVFPSLYEGFGWPIIEAQACGCPVFTSDRAPMTEVGGTAAVYFDPSDEAGAAKAIHEALPHSQSLVDEGLRNAARFTMDKMISGYCDAYEKAIAEAWGRPRR